MYRAVVIFPKSAEAALVEELTSGIAASFRSQAGTRSVTRNEGPLMGPGAMSGEAGWIVEADFETLDDAMAALDADAFQAVKERVESLTSAIFLFEVAEA